MPDETTSKRQGNAYLAMPVAAMEVEKGSMFKEMGLELTRIDTQYLAIMCIDFLAERLASGQGATREEIIELGVCWMEEMNPDTPPKKRETVIMKLLDRLANGADGYKSFSYPYFDSQYQRFLTHRFKLVEWWQPGLGEPHVYKATPEAVTLFLSMFTIDPVLEHAAQNYLIRHLLESGQVSGAVEVARKASGTSRAIRATLQNKLLELRRNPRKKGWVDDVLPRLKEARDHIQERLKEEGQLQRKIDDMLAASDPDAKEQHDLLKLRTVVGDCSTRHLELVGQIVDAIDGFHAYQAYAFKSPRVSVHISPETDILPYVMDMPLAVVAQMSEEKSCRFLGPVVPKVLDLFELCNIFQKSRERQEEGALKTPEVREMDDVWTSSFDPECEERIRNLVQKLVLRGKAGSTSEVLQAMDGTDGLVFRDYLCAMHVMRTIFRHETPLGIEAEVQGLFDHAIARGSDLALRPSSSANLPAGDSFA